MWYWLCYGVIDWCISYCACGRGYSIAMFQLNILCNGYGIVLQFLFCLCGFGTAIPSQQWNSVQVRGNADQSFFDVLHGSISVENHIFIIVLIILYSHQLTKSMWFSWIKFCIVKWIGLLHNDKCAGNVHGITVTDRMDLNYAHNQGWSSS